MQDKTNANIAMVIESESARLPIWGDNSIAPAATKKPQIARTMELSMAQSSAAGPHRIGGPSGSANEAICKRSPIGKVPTKA